MARVDVCPKNLTDVIEASKKLGCGNDAYGNNQYLCLPNVNKTSLVEFCYNGTIGFQEKGILLNFISDQEVNPFVNNRQKGETVMVHDNKCHLVKEPLRALDSTNIGLHFLNEKH